CKKRRHRALTHSCCPLVCLWYSSRLQASQPLESGACEPSLCKLCVLCSQEFGVCAVQVEDGLDRRITELGRRPIHYSHLSHLGVELLQ
ncbi:hypothetical protein LEMLEM_LOCUS12887, partial [Lemmus lemmus]